MRTVASGAAFVVCMLWRWSDAPRGADELYYDNGAG